MLLYSLRPLRLLSAGIVTLSLFAFTCPAFADEVLYFYDSSGRLVRAAQGPDTIIYEYDQVGNLLSISKGTASQDPPTLQNIIPDLAFIGFTTPVMITGQNLFTAKTITSDNPLVSLRSISVSDTAVKADVTVSPTASPGTANITVTTLYGSASISITLSSSRLSFDPPGLTMSAASTGTITASVIPPIGRNLTIILRSTDRSIVSSPESLTIPSGGTASFTVNALREGVANINSGTPNTVVLVTSGGALLPGEQVINRAGPVSVYIDPPPGNASVASSPVSAKIDVSPVQNAIAVDRIAVSVDPPVGQVSAASLRVSVYVVPAGDSTVASLPVSVKISP